MDGTPLMVVSAFATAVVVLPVLATVALKNVLIPRNYNLCSSAFSGHKFP